MIWHCLINFWMPIELYRNFPRNSLRLVPQEVFIHQALKDKMTPNRTSDNSKRQVGLAAWPTWPLLGKVQHFQYFFSKKSLTWPSLLKAEVPCKGKSSFRMCLTQEISSTSGAVLSIHRPQVTGVWKNTYALDPDLAKAKPMNQKSKIQFNSKIQHPNVWIWILSANQKSGLNLGMFKVLKQEAIWLTGCSINRESSSSSSSSYWPLSCLYWHLFSLCLFIIATIIFEQLVKQSSLKATKSLNPLNWVRGQMTQKREKKKQRSKQKSWRFS